MSKKLSKGLLMNTKHKQVKILYPFSNEKIEVDKGIASLLSTLWGKGIMTLFSCQGDDVFREPHAQHARSARAYIMMVRNDEALELIHNIISEYKPFKRYGRKISWDFEFDLHETFGSRIVIRFPSVEIDRFKSFVENNI